MGQAHRIPCRLHLKHSRAVFEFNADCSVRREYPRWYFHGPQRKKQIKFTSGKVCLMRERLSLSHRIARLRSRLREPEWRRYGTLLLAGKLTGIGLLVLVAAFLNPGLLGSRVFAADPVLKGNDIVNPINTVFTLVAAFLVFGMQVGFTMLEAGFCRSRETVNVLMECIVDNCLCGILFYAWGFACMFSHGTGLIGLNWFFLNNPPATYETTGVAFLAFWIFQFAFADTCSTITPRPLICRTAS